MTHLCPHKTSFDGAWLSSIHQIPVVSKRPYPLKPTGSAHPQLLPCPLSSGVLWLVCRPRVSQVKLYLTALPMRLRVSTWLGLGLEHGGACIWLQHQPWCAFLQQALWEGKKMCPRNLKSHCGAYFNSLSHITPTLQSIPTRANKSFQELRQRDHL